MPIAEAFNTGFEHGFLVKDDQETDDIVPLRFARVSVDFYFNRWVYSVVELNSDSVINNRPFIGLRAVPRLF
jgi:hypothetical protein